jgi:hypothetical protein
MVMELIGNTTFGSAGDMEADKTKAEHKTKAKRIGKGNDMGHIDLDQIERVEMLKISTFEPT